VRDKIHLVILATLQALNATAAPQLRLEAAIMEGLLKEQAAMQAVQLPANARLEMLQGPHAIKAQPQKDNAMMEAVQYQEFNPL